MQLCLYLAKWKFIRNIAHGYQQQQQKNVQAGFKQCAFFWLRPIITRVIYLSEPEFPHHADNTGISAMPTMNQKQIVALCCIPNIVVQCLSVFFPLQLSIFNSSYLALVEHHQG